MSPEELADALWYDETDEEPGAHGYSQAELRTLAREAAKQALFDAANDLDLPGSTSIGYYASEADAGYAEAQRHAESWLIARAEQIGKDSDG